MTNSTKIDKNIEGAENFRAWKYIFMPILEEHDLEGQIKDEVKDIEGDEAKAKNKKDMIEAKRIMYDSINDCLMPQVSSKNTPK